jgi:hypothetical protein
MILRSSFHRLFSTCDWLMVRISNRTTIAFSVCSDKQRCRQSRLGSNFTQTYYCRFTVCTYCMNTTRIHMKHYVVTHLIISWFHRSAAPVQNYFRHVHAAVTIFYIVLLLEYLNDQYTNLLHHIKYRKYITMLLLKTKGAFLQNSG